MTNLIFVLAPAGGMEFVAMPSGTVYVANAAGLITIASGAVADQQALLAQGCTALLPRAGGTATAQPGNAYTVQNADQNNAIVFTASSAVVVTLPNAMPQGFAVELVQGGAGTVAAAAGSGATLVTPNQAQTPQQYGALLCLVIDNTTGANAQWDVVASPATTGAGLVGAATLASLYAQDAAAHYTPYAVAQVLSDPTGANNGIWLKTGTGNGAGNWTQESTLTLAGVSAQATANAAAIAALQAAVGGTQQIGPATVVASGAQTSSSALSLLNAAAATVDGTISSIEVAVAIEQTATVFVANLNNDNTLSLVSSAPVNLSSGVNTILSPGVSVSIGQYIGIEAQSVYGSGSGLAAWYASGLIGSHAAFSSTANFGLQFQANISGGLVPQVAALETAVPDLETVVGGVQFIGPNPAEASGSTTSSTALSMFNATPATGAGFIELLSIASSVSQSANILVVTLNSDNTLSLVSSTAVSLAIGVSTFVNTGIPIEAGQYVGIEAQSLYQSGSGLSCWYAVGTIGSHTAFSTVANCGLQLGVILTGGMAGQAAANGGLGSVLAVDPSGNTDSTASFEQARNDFSSLVYVPPGTHSITSWPGEGDGFYGPGHVKNSGCNHPIFSQPRPRSMWGSLRSALQTVLMDSGALCLIGDSISQGYGPTAIAQHWTYMLTAFLNFYTSPGDLMSFCAFDNNGATMNSYPAFYGVTVPTSPTIGSNGPTGKSIILSSGQSISVVGAFSYVDVFYTQQPGAGLLSFSYNGGSAYKTVNCSGAAALDKCTYPSATGESATGTFTITASGGSVEITGLIRLAITASDLPESPPRIPVMNFSHGGYQIPNFSSAMLTSMLAQAGFMGGSRHAAIIELGGNDVSSYTPPQIYSNLTSMISTLKAGGIKDIWGCGVLRPSSGAKSYYAGTTDDNACAAVRAAYQDAGVPIIAVDAVDWSGLSLYSDGLHPNNGGQIRFLQIVAEDIAG